MDRRGSSGQGDDEGAVAVVVAICLVVLLGLSAFAVDFGMAYTNDRQLQTAADAAALAAVSVYEGESGNCAALAARNDLRDAAHERATQLMRDNHSTASGPSRLATGSEPEWRPTCPGDVLTVTWDTEDPVDTGLGGVFGVSQIETNASAAAALLSTAIPAVSGLRPYGVCSSEIEAVLPSNVVRVNFEGHAKGNACDGLSGNWRQLDCPGDSPAKLEESTEFGCDNLASVVADQPPPGDPTLPDHLLAACPPTKGDSNEYCLSADPGNNFTANKVIQAWDTLLGERVSLPVTCGTPSCVPNATRFPDTNGQYPIHRIVDVTVCGYHWQKNKKADVTTGDCAAANNPLGLDVDPDTTQDQYLLLVFQEATPVSGGPGGGGSGSVALTR